MATRQIEIKISGESGQYEATVQRIIEKNNQMNRAAQQGAEQTAGAFGSLQRILINLPSLLGGLGAGLASAFSISGVILFTKRMIDAAGEIDDLAKKTGFARQTLSGLKSTIEENGGSLQAFATAINKAQKSLGDIEGDGKKAGEALKAMGLNVNELTKATPEKFFEKFAKSLSEVESQNQRVALATKVLSRAGADQIPIVLELADKFKTLKEQGVSDANIKQLDKFGDALTRLKNSAFGLAQDGLANLIRGFDRLFKISDLEKARSEVAKFADQLEILDKKTKSAQGASGLSFGVFSGKETQEQRRQAQLLDLQNKRTTALQGFIDANDKLIRLEQGDKDKPPTGGGSLPAPIDEGAAKRQLDALEAAKTKLAQVALQMAEARRAAGEYNVEVRSLALALYEQEKAAAVAAAKGNKSYTEELGRALEAEKQNKIAQFEAAEAAIRRKDELQVLTGEIKNQQQSEQDLAAVVEATAKDTAILNARKLEEIEIIKQLNDLEVQRLIIIGNTTEAERLRLLGQIEYIEALKARAEAEGQDNRVRDAQLRNVQTQVQQLGTVTVNVGNTIANSLGDAFEGVILGTRKLADVGKGLMAALLRDIGQFFTQALIKKLGFENLLLTNANSFGPQIAGAITGSGSSTVGGGLPGSQQTGVLNNILGSLGGSVNGLASLLSGGTFASSFGFGSAGAGVAGPLMANGGFFSSIGGFGSGGGGIFSSIVSPVLNGISNLWNAFTSTTLGASVASAIATSTATIASTVSTTLVATLDTLAAALANPVTWIAAIVIAVITAVYRIIANQAERPNAKFSGTFEGVSFDESLAQFVPGAINVAIGRKSGIKNSVAGQIANNLQQRLVVLADQWVGILNIFPDFIAEDIQPALDETNRRLNKNFANLKFSPGGSRSIQQELESLSGPDGLVRFFNAFQPSLTHAFQSTLGHAGIGSPQSTFEGFNAISPGFKKLTPELEKDWADFIKAIKDVAGLTSQLGSIGASKFLTPQDLTGVTSLFDQLFSVTDQNTFTKAAAEIQEKLKPITDFLEQSVQQSSELFGRGIMAALDAVSQSSAQAAFLETIGAGVKDVLFQGITDAFVASAQFGDLLAPIQQTIRDFTQQAVQTGQTPDIAAFRAAILPQITDISTRAQTLAPLIAALQELGFDFKEALKVFGDEVVEAVTEATKPASVEINIENYSNESDPAALARRIQELLSGRLQPAA